MDNTFKTGQTQEGRDNQNKLSVARKAALIGIGGFLMALKLVADSLKKRKEVPRISNRLETGLRRVETPSHSFKGIKIIKASAAQKYFNKFTSSTIIYLHCIVIPERTTQRQITSEDNVMRGEGSV